MRKLTLVLAGALGCGGSTAVRAPSVAARPVEAAETPTPAAPQMRTRYVGTVTIGKRVLLGYPYAGDGPPKAWHYRVELVGKEVQRYLRVSPRGRVSRSVRVEYDERGMTLRFLDGHEVEQQQRQVRDGEVTVRWRSGKRSVHGCASLRHVYDDRGRPIEITCVGARGQVQIDKDGCARRSLRYDDQNARVRMLCLDEQGRPKDDNHFIHDRRYVLGGAGEERRKSFRSLGPHPPGCEQFSFDYDAQLRRTEERCEHIDGTPASYRGPNQAVRAVWTFDDNDCSATWTMFDATGAPTLRRGIAEWRYVRNEQCEPLLQSTHGPDGGLVRSKRGIPAMIGFVRDELGRVIEQNCFGPDRAPTPCRAVGGVATTLRNIVDERGRLITQSGFDASGAPTRVSAAYPHRRDTTYDEAGRRVKEAFFDVDGRATTALGGVHAMHYTYDEHGNLALQSNRDATGAVVSPTTLCAQVRYERDEQLRLERVLCLGTDGKPRPSRLILHGVHIKEAAEVLVAREKGRTKNILLRTDGTVIDTIECTRERCLK